MNLINWFLQIANSFGLRKTYKASQRYSNVFALEAARPSAVTQDAPALCSEVRAVPQRVVRAVRVVRVSEPGMASQSAGRMVMSGRMADVCAELDRLAA
jgi:hypothetical protein